MKRIYEVAVERKAFAYITVRAENDAEAEQLAIKEAKEDGAKYVWKFPEYSVFEIVGEVKE